MPREKLIAKVQYKKEKLLIQWIERSTNGSYDEKQLKSEVEPHPDLIDALRALDVCQVRECELQDTEEEALRHDIQTLSVTYEWDDDMEASVMHASITSQRMMNDAIDQMSVSSPHKPESSRLAPTLHPDTSKAVYAVISEAKAYLDGKRNDLFAVKDEGTPSMEVAEA